MIFNFNYSIKNQIIKNKMVYAGKARLVSTENENWIKTHCGKTFTGRGNKTLLKLHSKKCDICNGSTKITASNNVIPKKTMKITAETVNPNFYNKFIEDAYNESLEKES